MEIKEIRNKPVSELNHLLAESRKKLDDLNFKVSQNQLKNIREVRVVKKDIAKIMMALKESVQSEQKKAKAETK